MSIPEDFMAGESGTTIVKTITIAGLVARGHIVAAFGYDEEAVRTAINSDYDRVKKRMDPEVADLLNQSELDHCVVLALRLAKDIKITITSTVS